LKIVEGQLKGNNSLGKLDDWFNWIFRDAEELREIYNVCGAKLVELSGIEPLTSCMPCKRSPS
jgi:hypothetical protein